MERGEIENMNAYGTHMPILESYIKAFRPVSVFEFGCGDFSTALFVRECRRVVSVEMQNEAWYSRMKEKHQSDNNVELLLALGRDPGLELLTSRFDLIFVDGHMQSRTRQCEIGAAHADTIIAHDTDQPCYHWHNIELGVGWIWIDIVSVRPWTSVMTRNPKVVEWTAQFKAQRYFDMEEKSYP